MRLSTPTLEGDTEFLSYSGVCAQTKQINNKPINVSLDMKVQLIELGQACKC